MKRKIITLMLALMLLFSLCACSAGYNKQIFDTNYKFNTAVILLSDGSTQTVNVQSWNDWENSDSIQFTDDNGVVYYTHISNVILEYVP